MLDREARRAERRSADADRQARLARRRPLAREARALEHEVEALEAERRDLEARLADTAFYTAGNLAQVQAATRRSADVARRLEEAESRWLELQAELDAIGEA
jgi:ATP-binding cassette subfamily F protein 3